MGYSLPSGVVNTDSAYFFADTTLRLGPLVKQLSDQTLVIVNYGQLTPPLTVTAFDFAVDVSSNPALVISYAHAAAVGSELEFLVSGGIAGQQYNITITVDPGASSRSDVLTVNIPSSSDDCAQINPVPSLYTQLPLGLAGYVNSAVRYFWGTQPPANPNVLDQWYNSNNATLYEWVTDGTRLFWQTLLSDDLVTEAPVSNLLFSRYNGYWVPDVIQADAPADGTPYARFMGGWQAIPEIIPDAPSTNTRYGRYNGVWQPDAIQFDAPSDANIYGRKGGAWTALTPIIPEAPQNGVLYSRVNSDWQPTPIQLDAPPDGQFYARNNRTWIAILVDQFLTDGPTDGTLYGRQNGAWVAAYPDSNPDNFTTAAQVAAAIALLMPRQGGNFTGAIGTPGLLLPNGPSTLQIAGGQPGQPLIAHNTSSTLAWGDIPIPEPPSDGVAYARQNGVWVPTASGAGLSEAPQDGSTYSRNNAAWVHLTHTDITDWTATLNAALAPYAPVTSVPLGSSSFPVMDGTNAIGTSLNWARADHVHPSDTSRYAASNPAGYQTAAQVSTALTPYALAIAIPVASNAAPQMDGVAAPGGSGAFSRADHVHPSDTSLYPVSNPAGYQTAAQVGAAISTAVTNAIIDCGTF
jgi:hypothetical protein